MNRGYSCGSNVIRKHFEQKGVINKRNIKITCSFQLVTSFSVKTAALVGSNGAEQERQPA